VVRQKGKLARSSIPRDLGRLAGPGARDTLGGLVDERLTMTNPPEPSRDGGVVVRRVDYPTHTEWFLTGLPTVADGVSAASVAATPIFEALARILATERIAVLQEKVYALRSAYASIQHARRAALAFAGITEDWPVTLLEGTPARGAAFAGVQLWGVTAGERQRVETVVWRGRPLGREWSGPDFRALLLASVDAAAWGEVPAASAPDQARRVFEAVTAALGERGYSYRQVARTWIYLSHILECYDGFNQVRNAHHTVAGLATPGKRSFPASTGIQARHDREECLMDVLAIDARPGGGLQVRPIMRSDRQGEAFAYGSAFARGVVIERDGRKVIHVSGTASIDAAGQSTHPGDAAAQCRETLLSIGAVLEHEGATLADIVQTTLFAKTDAVARTCRDVTRRLGLQALPFVEIIADVCRPELLVEIEAVAVSASP